MTSLSIAPLTGVARSARLLDCTIWEAPPGKPQLVVDEEIPAHLSGAWQLELDLLAIDGCAGTPALHFDFGNGFDETRAVPLLPGTRPSGRFSALVDLPARPGRIRIDPCAGAGRFLCSELRASQILSAGALPDERRVPRVGVIMHLSRGELWPQMAQYLSSIASLVRLYVCLSETDAASVEPQILARHPGAIVRRLSEGESGALSCLAFIRLAVSQGVDFVCFTHASPSPHLQGADAGRWDMTHKLLGSPVIVQGILDMLAADPSLGIVGPAGHVIPAAYLPGFDTKRVDTWLARLGGTPNDLEADFIAGSMFWARIDALLALRRLGLIDEEPAPLPLGEWSPAQDALDRCLPAAARIHGFSLAETRIDDSTTKSVLDFAAPSFVEAALADRGESALRLPAKPEKLDVALVPHSGLEALDAASGRWEATDNDPQLLIEGLAKHAGRWVLVTARLRAAFSVTNPTIYFNFGSGWTEAGSLALARSSAVDGLSETVCHLPPGFRLARLDPIAFPARFELRDFAVQRLTTVQAIERMWRSVAADPQGSTAPGEPGSPRNDAPASRTVSHSLERLVPEYRAMLSRLDTSYASWIDHYEIPGKDYASIALDQAAWSAPPTFSLVVCPQRAGGPALIALVESVIGQVYPHWELWIAAGTRIDSRQRQSIDALCRKDSRLQIIGTGDRGLSSAVNSALERASGNYFAVLDEAALLHQLALHFVAEAAVSHPGSRLVFTDEDRIGPDGARRDPLFKCELNYELLLAHDMVSRLACYRTALLREIGGMREGFEGSEDYDLALRVAERTDGGPAIHVPRVLYHQREPEGAGDPPRPVDLGASSRKAVADHLRRVGMSGEVLPAPGARPGMNRVRFAVPEPAPAVTIVIPTRDRADLLETCVDSILSLTTYGNYQVIIVDNGSRDGATRDLLARYSSRGLTVLRDDSGFNFSAINNRAIARASSEFVCLMNNDIEILTPEWLEEMIGMAARPGVGAVGARLWFPNRQLQHGGLILGIAGFAGYSHKFLPAGEPGYACRAILHQSFSAVTAACLLVRKSVFDEVGGLDERIPVAFDDVDFCLRLREAGYRNVWTPYAEMIHDESSSRGPETTPENAARLRGEMEFMRIRWGRSLFTDPCYSPNLSLESEDFSLAWPPRIAGHG